MNACTLLSFLDVIARNWIWAVSLVCVVCVFTVGMRWMTVLVSDWTQGPGVCSLLSGLSHNKELPPCEPGLGKTEVRTYIHKCVARWDGMEWRIFYLVAERSSTCHRMPRKSWRRTTRTDESSRWCSNPSPVRNVASDQRLYCMY